MAFAVKHLGQVLGIAFLVWIFRWNNGHPFKWFSYPIQVIIFGLVFYIGSRIGDLTIRIHLSIPLFNRIPDEVKKWTSASVFFIGCCSLSYKSWIHFNQQKRKNTTK